MIQPDDLLDLDVTKAAAGGRMLARHAGQVVLVWGAIPGERVRARVERVAKSVVFADTVDVLVPSADRRVVDGDWRCGGYRMRARLHADHGRLGFFREESHVLCDATRTGQLLPATNEWIASAAEALARGQMKGLVGIELAENVSGHERACHFELDAGAEPTAFVALADGLVGASARTADTKAATRVFGLPSVHDDLRLGPEDSAPVLRLTRDVRAFFQGNRYLLERFVRHVIERVPAGPIVDLYAGVGLFGLALAASGRGPVVLVEGDPVSGADLEANARPYAGLTAARRSVEGFLAEEAGRMTAETTCIVDPPRTGISRVALHGIVRAAPGRIVYVSCDVATLARDTRLFLDCGFELQELTALDLFPNTAHIETVAVFVR
jgi:tRNA/tmRNA/rRNA uracil-C5-methylase (TrmA/RlmC/RlmD family)